MDLCRGFAAAVLLAIIFMGVWPVTAAETAAVLEKSMSDTLDIWRDGRYVQLFEQLAHRGKTSRETFVKKMQETTVRPACCWQKMENFKVLNENRTEATVYVKMGLEGGVNSAESTTREFKLTHIDGVWKMQLADVLAIAGVSGKKSGAKRTARKSSPYP